MRTGSVSKSRYRICRSRCALHFEKTDVNLSSNTCHMCLVVDFRAEGARIQDQEVTVIERLPIGIKKTDFGISA